MNIIYLPNDIPVLVSAEDYVSILTHKWYEHKSTHTGHSYAYRLEGYRCPILQRSRRRKIYMHRAITGAGPGIVVDHKDRNILNNCRSNLRVTTGTFNNANRGEYYREGLTGFRGVTRAGWGNKFRARITFAGEEKYLGAFSTAEEAARVYDEEARKLFGEFAWLNFDTRQELQPEEIPF